MERKLVLEKAETIIIPIPTILVTNGPLTTVWKAVYGVTTESDDEKCNLPKICRNLDTWICSDAYQEDRRLSLRTSATLISGVAKLYKNSTCKLLEDVKTLDENITYRKRKLMNTSSPASNYNSSEYAATPEQLRREISHSYETSFSPRKRLKTNSNSRNNTPESYSMNRSSAESISTNMNCCTDSEERPESFSNNSDISSKQVKDSTSTVNQKEQGVQTSPTKYGPERDSSSSELDCLDKDLPFAYILVHDSYHSRIPSRIILSSINSDVRDLN